MRRLLIILFAVALAVASGAVAPAVASPSPGGDWKQLGFDSSHSWFNPDEMTLTSATVSTVHLLWGKGPIPETSAVMEHGHVIACAEQCYSRLVDTGAGFRTYTFRYAPPRDDAIAVGQGLLFSETSYQGGVEALRLDTGALAWSQGFHSTTLEGGPVYHAGRVFTAEGYYDPHVYAADATTGALLWATLTQRPGVSDGFTTPPTVAFNRVYVGSPTTVEAFREDNGRFRWLVSLDQVTQVEAGAGLVFVGSAEGVTALDPITGAVRWARKRTGRFAVAGDTLYLSAGRSLTAFDAVTGARRWSVRTGNPLGQPTVAGGLVWLARSDSLRAYDAQTGQLLWSTAGAFASVLVVGDGVVALGCFTETKVAGICVYGP
jgi:outer membrane protein assembly factor BamB